MVTAFVFHGSEETIDAPQLSSPETSRPAPPGRRWRSRPPVVRVIGGAPPPAGPLRLWLERGALARFRVRSDGPVTIRIPGYGLSERVERDRLISFRASRPGRFAVLVAGTGIELASLRVLRGRP